MKVGKNAGRYALGIVGGLLGRGDPLGGGLRTMLAIQQERGQKKQQEKLVDRLVAGLSKNNKPNPQGGNKGQDYTDKNKYDKDWPPPAPLKKAQQFNQMQQFNQREANRASQAAASQLKAKQTEAINPNREMLLADLRDPDTNKNYRYHPRTGKVSVDGQYLDGGGSPGPDVPGKIMPHPKASINPNREILMASSGLTKEQKAPYVREWQRHWDKNDSYTIKDPVRLKNLQDLVLYDRV